MKKANLILGITMYMVCFSLNAQGIRIPLWPNGTPNTNTPPDEEYIKVKVGNELIYNVSEAELDVYLPDKDKNTGASVVICPGGGYGLISINNEGVAYAKYLQKAGIAGIVLKYRLPYGKHLIPISDGLRAIRLVRSKAREWKLDANKIGVAGFSAGGHLASTVGTQWDLGNPSSSDLISRFCSRPDFMVLIYPVISFKEGLGHMGTRKNLIGETHNWRRVSKYCNELHVTSETPPTFLLHCNDDVIVSPLNSIEFYKALQAKKVTNELHIFPKGGHGFGMNKKNLPIDAWPELSVKWIEIVNQ